MDDKTLTDAYNEFAISRSCTLDGILCDPGLRESFLQELRARGGDAPESELLRRLMNLRKRGGLARKKPR